MIEFLKSKSFLISTTLFSLLFIMNVGVTDSPLSEIVLSIIKSLLAGIICGFVVGGIIFLIQKKSRRTN